jgi:phosphohistidine phosphatase
MKTLVLVRHAKSSWSQPGLEDRDRPLNRRGKRDAPKMGRRLAKEGVKPDLVLSSPARRALATARLIAKKVGYKRKDIRVHEGLYAVDPAALLKAIRKVGAKHKRVMLVGHNPELAELAHRLSPEIVAMPTCAVALMRFEGKSWGQVGKARPEKTAFFRPRRA